MSSTNKTAELHLSQFIGTDIPSILTDYNGDMQKIDAGVREVKQATAGAVSDLSSVTARVTNAEQDISGLNSTVQGIATKVVTAEGEIDALQTSIASKADASAVSALQTSVASKADASAVSALQGDVDNIEDVIPSSASASNKLATADDLENVLSKYKYVGSISGSTADLWISRYHSLMENHDFLNTVLYVENVASITAILFPNKGKPSDVFSGPQKPSYSTCTCTDTYLEMYTIHVEEARFFKANMTFSESTVTPTGLRHAMFGTSDVCRLYALD